MIPYHAISLCELEPDGPPVVLPTPLTPDDRIAAWSRAEDILSGCENRRPGRSYAGILQEGAAK